ncbi:hypothetical protein BKA65DRAFT_506717 [Rhexocercosporidium sp. MPI-PUGE-AT-0058]|nr:hypothetical protein BKA65DRAFT_506717 [Rhexocercosporidium sp. MPI-PUGE-AT-0058]
MLFKIGTLAILALSFGEIGALPSDSALDRVQLTERELSPIMERGLNYVCKSGNDFARCQQAKATLQARELRGCDVWSKL